MYGLLHGTFQLELGALPVLSLSAAESVQPALLEACDIGASETWRRAWCCLSAGSASPFPALAILFWHSLLETV